MADEQFEGLLPWALAAIGAIVSTLLGGVVTLFRMRESDQAKQLTEHKQRFESLEIRAEKCEQIREMLTTQCAVNAEKLANQADEIEKLTARVARIDRDGTHYQRDKHE